MKPCGFGISARCHLSLKILLDSIQLPTLLGEVNLEITQMKAISFCLQVYSPGYRLSPEKLSFLKYDPLLVSMVPLGNRLGM